MEGRDTESKEKIVYPLDYRGSRPDDSCALMKLVRPRVDRNLGTPLTRRSNRPGTGRVDLFVIGR